MQTVGIRQLKARLSEFLRRVRAGETILVTSRGEIVAELRPPPLEQSGDLPAGLVELVRQGKARNLRRNDPALYRSHEPARPEMTSNELLDWTRADPDPARS